MMSSGQGKYFNKIILPHSVFPAANGDKLSKVSLLIRTEQANRSPKSPQSVAFFFFNGETNKVEQVSLGFMKTANC